MIGYTETVIHSNYSITSRFVHLPTFINVIISFFYRWRIGHSSNTSGRVKRAAVVIVDRDNEVNQVRNFD